MIMALTQVRNAMLNLADAGIAPAKIDYAFPKHFAGAGDTSNQATAFQAFINTLVAGDIVDLQGQTIYLGSMITISTSNIKLMNGTFVVHSDMLSTSSVFRVTGTAASAIALTGTAGRGNFTLTMASTASLSKDQLVLLYSDDLYARRSSAEVNSSELCYIRSISSGTQAIIYQPFAQDYTTGDNASIIPITPVKNVTFDRITIDGTANDANIGIEVIYGQNVEINNCVLLDLFNRGVEFQTSYACTVRDCIIQVDGSTAMYGVAIIDGSRSIQVISNTFHRCRHGVTHGGGYVNRDCWIAYNSVYGATNAGLDAHAGADNVHFHSNAVHVEGSDGTNDGIIYQGTNGRITENTIYGTVRVGIYYQSMAYVATDDRDYTVTICGNTINTDVCDKAINVETDDGPTSGETTAELSNVVIADNNCTNRVEFADSTIRVYANGASIRNITISGNTIRRSGDTASSHGIEVRALTGYVAHRISITGNTIWGEEGALADGINLNGATANSIRYGAVTGNVIQTCDTGVKGTNTYWFIVSGNSVFGDVTADFSMGVNDTVTANRT
jgi:hypothetical protein